MENSKIHVATIMGLMLEGHPRHDIQEWAQKTEIPDFDERWDDAIAMLKQQGRENRGVIRDWGLLAMQECHRRLMDIGDYSEAAKIAEKIVKVFF